MLCGDDLQRLQRLLEDASLALLGHFTSATQHIDAALQDLDAVHAADPLASHMTSNLAIDQAIDQARGKLAGAITALQFEDMATQLISHTTHRLRSCADQLGQVCAADADDCPAARRANPVAQQAMTAGSIELF